MLWYQIKINVWQLIKSQLNGVSISPWEYSCADWCVL